MFVLEGEKVCRHSSGTTSHTDNFLTDNHMINGTKLLTVAGMTRRRRDGILKSEKVKHVVKDAPMDLKGVWYVFSALRSQIAISRAN